MKKFETTEQGMAGEGREQKREGREQKKEKNKSNIRAL